MPRAKITEPSEFEWRENMRRVVRILRPLIGHRLVAAVCDMDTVNSGLVWQRLFGEKESTQIRDRRHSAFLRVFLENFIKALEVAFMDMCEAEKKRWGFNLPVDQLFEQEIKDFFALLVANQQERKALLTDLVDRWPRILFRGRTEKNLFSSPWISIPRLDLPDRDSGDSYTSLDPQSNQEQSQVARRSFAKRLRRHDP